MRLLLMPALLLGLLVMSPLASAELLLGVGKADVTGIIAQSTMVGFADPEQIAAGLHTRLWARAFVATDDADPSQTRVAFVSADIGMPAQAVRMEVARVSSQASCVFACGSSGSVLTDCFAFYSDWAKLTQTVATPNATCKFAPAISRRLIDSSFPSNPPLLAMCRRFC